MTVVGQLVCADIDRSRLTALRRGAPRPHPPSVVQADLRGALPFATGTFDLVFNLRYLHHAEAGERRRALAELVRVSSRNLLVSYYRRSNLHALVRELQAVTRGNRRRGPAMLERHEFERLLREVGCRTMREKPLFPWFHAQRVVLLEKQRESDGSAAGRVREHERRIPHPGRRPLSSPATAQRTLHARRRGRRGLPD